MVRYDCQWLLFQLRLRRQLAKRNPARRDLAHEHQCLGKNDRRCRQQYSCSVREWRRELAAILASAPGAIVTVTGGESWLPCKPFEPDFVINSVAISAGGDIWLAARSGLYRSTDAGDSWKRITTLRLADIRAIQFDDENHRMLVLSGSSTSIFESPDSGRTWSAINTGWPLRNLRLARGRLLGTTAFDGIVMQPEATASSAQAMTGIGAR